MKTVNIRKGKRVPMTAQMRKILLHLLIPKYGSVCWYCGIKLSLYEIHIDHVNPLSKGGADTLKNCALACVSCNRGKWDLALVDFFKWVKRLRAIEEFPAKKAFVKILDKTEIKS